MVRKNSNFKKTKNAGLILILLVFFFFLLLDNYNFNKNMKELDYDYSLYVTYSLANKSYTTENTTIDEAIKNKEKILITTLHETVPLIKKNEKEYYVDFTNIVNDKLLDDVVDYTFAKFNTNGEVVKDCKYDKKTKTATIPIEYINSAKKEEKKTTLQLQVLSRIDKKTISHISYQTKIKKLFTTSKLQTQNGLDLTTNISISKYKKNTKLSKNNIKIYLNNSKTPLNENYYTWNSKAGVVELKYPSLLVNNVNIKLENNSIKNLFITKSKAVTDTGQNINSKISDSLVVTNVDETALENMLGGKEYHASGIDNTAKELANLSVNITYHYGDCVGDSTDTSSWGSSEIPDIRYSYYYDGTHKDYDNACIPFTMKLSELNKLQLFTFSDDLIGLYCMHTSGAATDPSNFIIYVVAVDIDLNANYAVLELSSGNTLGNQTAHVVFKVTWEEQNNSEIRVEKKYTGGIPGVDAATEYKATFRLYEGSNCQTTAGVSDIVVTGAGSASFTNLKAGHDYSVREISLQDKNGNSLSGSWVTNQTSSNQSGNSCKNVTTPSTGSTKTTVNFDNVRKRYCYKVKKADAESTSTTLAGVKFSMGNQECTTASGTGKCTFTDLNYQSYTLKETTAAASYFNENSSGATIPASSLTLMKYNDNGNYECPSTANTKIFLDHKKYYCLRIKKTDYKTGTALSGATYNIKSVSGSDISIASTNKQTKNGITSFFMGTTSGTFNVTESTAPTGYLASTQTYQANTFILGSSSNPLTSADAKKKCFDSSTIDATISATIPNKKLLINFKKYNEDSTKTLKGANFVIKDVYGKYIGHKKTMATTIDEKGVSKYCYEYYSTSTQYTYETNNDGEICVAKLPSGLYTIEETDAPESHTLSSKNTMQISTSTSFSSSNIFTDCATRFEFTKTTTNDSNEDSTLKAITTSQLKKLKWQVYDSSGTKLKFVLRDGVYHYSDASDVSGTEIETLYLNDNRKIIIEHLPIGTYSLKEEETDGCTTGEGITCNSNGFYYPENAVSFEITEKSSSCAGSISSKTASNEPTMITLTKKDIYNYLDANDTVKFEDIDEINAFDKITFNLKDKNGSTLKLKKIRDVGDCSSDTSYSEYRYFPSGDIDDSSLTTNLNTCGGNIHITHLCRDNEYSIEEVSVPSNSVFTKIGNVSVTYNIPSKKSGITSTSNTNTISDIPTRVVIKKVDASDTSSLINDESTIFNIYRCKDSSCLNKTLVHFSERSKLTNDNEDNGKEVYKFKNSNGVTDLNPYHGEIILRYLPLGNYIAVEKNAPDGFYNPTNSNNSLNFTVSDNSVSSTYTMTNDPTKIYLKKSDIYKYYSSDDKVRIENDDKLLDTVKFVLRDKDGNKLKLLKVEDGVYRYSKDGTISEISTYNGSLVISHLTRSKKYYIEEIKTTDEEVLILPTNKKYSDLPFDNKGHAVVTYNLPETIPENTAVTREIENSPTRVVFYKIDSIDNTIIKDETTTFNIYQCSSSVTTCTSSNGTLVNFSERETIYNDTEDNGKEVYKYSKLNQGGVTDLHPYQGELIIRYLPANYKYVLVEIKAPYGYYDPTINVNESTEFTVRNESYDERSNYELVTDKIKNEPTIIEFTKNDVYSYYNPSDIVKFEDGDELRAFDDITFRLTDADGNTLKVSKVLDSGDCTKSDSYSEYRYYEKKIEGVSLTDELHSCGGNIHVTHLYRGVTYKIEEIKVEKNSVFILTNNHPFVTYTIPLTKDKVTKSNSTSTISNVPTRIVLNKIDARTNDKIIDEKTTFNIYRCLDTVSECTETNGTLLHFEKRAIITADKEDNGKQVYKYKKTNSNGETNLHPYNGELILRYLPSGYKYVAVEVKAPDGYYNPVETNNKTEFTVSKESVDISKNIINDYTKLYLQKTDIYNYYSEEDQSRIESDEKLLDTVKFVLRDEDGNILKLRKVQDGEYRYIPVTSSNTIEEINTYKGSLVITHLYRNKKYYIEEVKTSNEKNLILPTNKQYSNLPFDNKGHAVVTYNLPNNLPDNSDVTELIENSPTRVVFHKINKTTKELILDEKTTFNIYQCSESEISCTKENGKLINFTERGVILGDKEDDSKEVYKYSKLNEKGITDLHPYQGELIIRYLPSGYKYVLIETNAPDGYYNPTVSVDEATEFTVKSESYSSTLDYEVLTDNVENTPTKIIFKKSDFYKYYDNNDNKEITSDVKLIDTAEFVLRDENGNILKLKKTGTTEEEGNIYRYLEVDENNKYTNINTYKGNLTITNLYRNKVYYIEEVNTTNPKNFILPKNLYYEGLPFDNKGHPVVKYTLSDTSPVSMESVTREIENKPTRVRFEKRDSKYNYLIPDETTTFNVYQCKENTECHPTDKEDKNSTLINFSERGIIPGDEEDSEDAQGLSGVEVYKYSKLNQSGVTDLHPYHGLLILRYLPAGYDYVLVEVTSPLNYSLPEGTNSEVRFTVSSTSVDIKEVDVSNKPTSLIVRKYTDDGELLEGAEFKIYQGLSTCDSNLSAMNQPHGEALGLKTIRDGHYELRPTYDTKVFKTCTDKEGSSCSDINNDLTYTSYQETYSDWQNSFEIEDGEIKKVEIQKGEALIQYLEYGHCYIIEEVKAPTGYSLPSKKKDRFTMVNITNENTVIDTYKELINKPTLFTFYKYDEYNNLLDGAEFKLQKLNNNKIYEDIPVTKIVENDKTYYKMDKTSNEYTIETSNGSASIYYLEEGQYRIIETKAPEGKELPNKSQNIVTFFVDNEGNVFGENVISNKPKTERIKVKPDAQAELVVNIQTGQKIIRYGLIIAVIMVIISILIIIQKKLKKEN